MGSGSYHKCRKESTEDTSEKRSGIVSQRERGREREESSRRVEDKAKGTENETTAAIRVRMRWDYYVRYYKTRREKRLRTGEVEKRVGRGEVGSSSSAGGRVGRKGGRKADKKEWRVVEIQ